MSNLFWNPLSGFELADPLWIASSHFSATPSVFKQWANFHPAAITLKSSSVHFGGSGRGGKRLIIPLHQNDLYCDGDKTRELLDIPSTYSLLQCAQSYLPTSKVGVSVLLGENYELFKKAFSDNAPSFIELNLKYSVRPPKTATVVSALEHLVRQTTVILEEVASFLKVFASYPVFVKVSREIPWLGHSSEMSDLLDLIGRHGKAGLIVANTERYVVPPSASIDHMILQDGIIAGRSLFNKTFHLTREIAPLAYMAGVPIIASGGIFHFNQIIDLIEVGASAVQLCSAIHFYGMSYLMQLREDFARYVHESKVPTYMNLVANLQTSLSKR
jgi:dihydroorotate dehydrogenase